MKKLGKIIIIVSCSGTGKTTLIKRLREDFPNLSWSVSCTTRPMRENEKHGEDYYFLTKDDFERKIKANDFIEWAVVHSNYYGTSKSFVRDGISTGKILLFDIDVQGADALKKEFGNDAKAIFIAPPSLRILKERLERRGTDSKSVIEERMKNAERELKRKNDYDYLIVNDELEKAYNEFRAIVESIIRT